MELLNFQRAVIDKALEKMSFSDSFVFQAPTGTGKTFIIANLISEMIFNYNVLNPEDSYTYIFLAPSTGDLYSQSYEKMELWMNKNILKNFNIINNKATSNNSLIMPYRTFEKDSVYFFGWSSLIKKGNKITSEITEKNNFWKTLDRTKNNNTKIVLIIDEAHLNNTKISKEFINKISPNKIIKMSATISKGEDIDYRISYSMAVEEKIVKKNFSINSNITISEPSWRDYINAAINKQEEIKNCYKKNKIFQNPLMIIQIPDMKSNSIVDEEIIFEYLLNKLKIPEFKIAIYLDKIKTHNKNEITASDSEVEILIFKQAIATGWDIPRANMYVRLRSIKEESFKIQSIGRVLRNPLLKYYDNYLIDNCFVYTDSDELIQELVNNFSEQINRRDYYVKPNYKNDFKTPINLMKLNYNFDFNNIDKKDVVNKILSNQENINNFIKNVEYSKNQYSSYVVSYEESIENLMEHNKIASGWLNSRQLQFHSNNLTLLEIKNLALFKYKNNSYYQIILTLSKNLSIYKNIKMKDFYFAIIKNNNFRKELENLIYLTIKESLNIETEKFLIPDIMKYDSESFGKEIDESLTPYNDLSLYSNGIRKKDFDSDLEQNFYNFLTNIKEKYNLKLIFRNSTDENSYYFNYVSSSGKIRKFFPDFIIMQNDKYIVCDTKGEYYVDEINEKLEAFTSYRDYIVNNNFEVYFGMVYKIKENYFELRSNELNCNIEYLFKN